MGRLKDKVAIITGAASGMGESHARQFIDEGAKVVVTDINEEAGQELVDELGDNAIFIRHDVTSSEDWTSTINKVKETFGAITTLVNNAGFPGPATKIGDMEDDDYLNIININLNSMFYGIKAIVPEMIENGGGSIINIASASSYRHIDMNPNVIYTTAKHAVVGITKGAAVEYGKHNIRVNSISPGGVLTPMTEAAVAQEQIDAVTAEIPLGRMARSEDISKTVVFLASDESDYYSGADLLVDGGLLAH